MSAIGKTFPPRDKAGTSYFLPDWTGPPTQPEKPAAAERPNMNTHRVMKEGGFDFLSRYLLSLII
ncbi:hypothetical protein FACS1894130_11740 [Spirochaetia bacterium]|nr:hypothetical protein FACS1894130_11740 [Spirochaetia bacterium]